MVARNLREIIPAFFVGPGGQPLTEEQARTRQELAESLLAQATDTSPTAGGWTSVLAKGVQGFAAGRQRNRAEEGLRLAGERDADLSRSLLRGVSLGSPAASSSLPLGAAPVGAVASQPLDPISDRVAQAHGGSVPNVDPRIATGIVETANALGIDPVDLATTISYETGGTFDPTKKGPTTQWGQHMGLIQFGEPQAQEHGVDWARPIESQLGANGAVASYLRRAGVKPGMGLLDVYSAINAGAPGLYNRSDANNGGAPGTVRDKVEQQMDGHRAKAQALLAPYLSANVAPDASAGLMAYAPQQPQGGALASAPFASAGLPVAPVTEDVIVATTPEEVLAAEMATGMIPDPLSLPENQITMDYVEPQGGAYVDPVVARANPNGIVDLGPGRPGERRRGPDGQMYQYVETSGMTGDSGGWGWIRAAEGGPIGMGIDPNDPSTIPAMAGGTRDVITALDPAMGYFPPAPSASRGAFPPAPTAQAAASSPSSTGGGASVGGVNSAIIEALSSPYASAQTKQIAGMLLEQHMQAQDPMRALQLEKARLELDAMRNPQGQKLINAGDGRLYDPNTGQWITAPDMGAPKLSEAEARIQRLTENLMQTGAVVDPQEAQNVAVGIVDGRLKTDRHPLTGELQVVDIATGHPIYGRGVNTQSNPPETPSSPTVDTGQFGDQFPSSREAFGVGGAAANIINRATDAAGMGPAYPEIQQTQTDFAVLRESLLNDIASTYGRQPPSWLLKEIRELTPEAGSVFQGPEAAQSKLRSLGRHLAGELDNTNRALMRDLSPTNRQELEARQQGLISSIDRLNRALGSFSAPQGQERGEGPQPGQVEDGYRFLGGDPADPSNWEAVQ